MKKIIFLLLFPLSSFAQTFSKEEIKQWEKQADHVIIIRDNYGVPHIYFIEPGVHDFKVWKNGLFMFSQLIFKPVDPGTFSKYPVRPD